MDKKYMDDVRAFGAAGTNNNIFSGNRFERAPFDGWCHIYACSSVAASATLELNVGGRSASAPMTVNANNRVPIEPDDLLITSVLMEKGELVQARVVVIAALTTFVRAVMEPAPDLDESGNYIG